MQVPSVTVCPAMLGAHLPAALAHKVLFVGQAIREFETGGEELGALVARLDIGKLIKIDKN